MTQRLIQIFLPFIFSILVLFLQSCYTTTHRGPWTVKPGQISPSVNYIWVKGTDADESTEPMELIGLEGRYGLLNRLDLGYMRTFDISSYMDDFEEGANMNIYDIKFQLVDNYRFGFALQLIWADMADYKDDDHFWINSIVLSIGEERKQFKIFGNFKIDHYENEIQLIPTWLYDDEYEFRDFMKVVSFGLELPNNNGIYPVLEVGRYFTDDLGDGLNIINAGINYYRPR